MSPKVRVQLLRPIDTSAGVFPAGGIAEMPEAEAAQLIERGLAKAVPAPKTAKAKA